MWQSSCLRVKWAAIPLLPVEGVIDSCLPFPSIVSVMVAVAGLTFKVIGSAGLTVVMVFELINTAML